MDRPTLEVADVFRRYGDAYRDGASPRLSIAQRRVMTAIETCLRVSTIFGAGNAAFVQAT